MIRVRKSHNADTRTADDNVTKEMLKNDTLSHMEDVKNGCKFIADKLIDAGNNHDYTKIKYLDDFYNDFISRKKGGEFKKLGWFQKHLQERHHLNDKVPNDVNLIDVMEMVIDCCVAGMARSGEVYDIEIDDQILRDAVQNTKNLIIKNIELLDESERWW